MANGAKLATAWLELVVSTEGAQGNMVKEITGTASKAGDAAGQSLGSQLLGGMKKFAGPIAALAAGFSVAKLVNDSQKAFTDLVGATNALQRIAGGTKEQVSGLRGAIQLSGVDAGKASGALTIFSKNLGNASQDGDKAAAMAQTLGTSFLDASGNVKPMSEILPGLSDKFKSMPDGAEKTALAMQLFGRQGATMLPFLNKGSEGIGELTDKAKKMGLVVDDVASKAFGNARASQREYSMSIQGLMVTLGGGLLPIFTAVQNVMRGSLIPVIQAVTGFLGEHRDKFIQVADAIDSFATRLGAAVSGILGFLSGGSTVDLATALGLSETSGIVQTLSGLRNQFSTAGTAIKDTFTGIASALGPAFAELGPVFASLLPQIMEIWQSLSPMSLLFNALLPVLPMVADLISQLAVAFGGVLAEAIAVLAPAIVEIGGVLSGALISAVQALMPIITMIVGAVVQLLPLFTPILALLSPLISAIMSLVTPLLALIEPIIQLIGMLLPPLVELLLAIVGPILAAAAPLLELLIPALTWVAEALGVVIGWIASALTWFVQLITGNEQAGKQFQTVWDGVLGFFRGIGQFFADIWNGLISGITGFIVRIVVAFQQIPQKILAVFSGAGTWLLGVGQNIIQGLLDGAGSLLRNVGSFFLNMLPGWIVGPFKSAMGIHSPSRVMYGLGDDTVDGLDLALMNGRERITASMRNLAAVPQAGTFVVGGAAASSSRGNAGALVAIHGNVYGDPEHVATAIEDKRRRASATYGVGSIK